jgi:hypothetical protein
MVGARRPLVPAGTTSINIKQVHPKAARAASAAGAASPQTGDNHADVSVLDVPAGRLGLGLLHHRPPDPRERGSFRDFYSRADTFWGNAGEYLKGFRTRIAAWLVMLPSALIGLYDFLLPIVADIDFAPVTAKVPAVAWPLILLAVGALFRWLRKVTTTAEG